jgi:D-serine deaminase-like pyridoxal phosphate-dependent protein
MKHVTIRRGHVLIAVGVALLVLVALLRPSDHGAPYTPYFAALNKELKANGPGRPVIIVDLDRLDSNLSILKSVIRPPLSFRIVVKSLPSMKLVRYIMEKTGTKKFMVFHGPDVSLLAEAFGGDIDILLGKPMPVSAVREFYRGFTGRSGFNPAAQVQWLADTPARVQQYLALARERNISMKISVEIDVGLHRGGVTTFADLGRMLDIIASSRGALAFSGFMGYDVHAGSAPAVFSGKEKAIRAAYDRTMERYRAFYTHARAAHPALFAGPLTFNSGGSQTYRLFTGVPPVNDVSVGTGLVKPSDFDTILLKDHKEAFFVATPVLKKLRGTTIPFLESMSWLWSAWDPNAQVTYFIYGGEWRAAYCSPAGLQPNGLFGKSTNQAFVNGSERTGIGVDDYVFLRPTQSEGIMREFGDILLVRGGKIVDRWPVFPE